jgi:hypothetical protein
MYGRHWRVSINYDKKRSNSIEVKYREGGGPSMNIFVDRPDPARSAAASAVDP